MTDDAWKAKESTQEGAVDARQESLDRARGARAGPPSEESVATRRYAPRPDSMTRLDVAGPAHVEALQEQEQDQGQDQEREPASAAELTARYTHAGRTAAPSIALDDDDTLTRVLERGAEPPRLAHGEGGRDAPPSAASPTRHEDDALPAFSLDEEPNESSRTCANHDAAPGGHDRAAAPADGLEATSTTRRGASMHSAIEELMSVTRRAEAARTMPDAPPSVTREAGAPRSTMPDASSPPTADRTPPSRPETVQYERAPASATTAVFDGPLPSMARPSTYGPSFDAPLTAPTSSGFSPVPSAELELVPSGSAPPAVAEQVRAARPPESRQAEPEPDSIEIRLSSSSMEVHALSSMEVHALSSMEVHALAEIDVEEVVSEEVVSEEIVIEELPAVDGVGRAPAAPGLGPSGTRELQAAALEQADAEEERELLRERRFGALLALYRQRLARADSQARKTSLLLEIAGIYETGLEDVNQAFDSLVEAFEAAPTNEEVITAIDRVGQRAGRIGELADRVKNKLLAPAPEDKRVAYLGHLVYWYERVLGRGAEISSFVSDIERRDKVHPVVLKRAAQLAAMNGDTKMQREHLLRALERTVRREERVALHLSLAGAFAGTTDAAKHYHKALEIDPTSIVALQGLKRLAQEKEQHAQVQWALERQAEVAPTEAERVDALVELAELQETKFLRRDLAAELLERVLELDGSHPVALRGLERCYHALRDWTKLVRVLDARAEHTFDKPSKIELLELAAEVHESKLMDLRGAVGVYERLLVVEPKHRRALGDLARLHDKLGDWAELATYRARLAELAPTKRAWSQELVKLGDLLAPAERDPSAAKLQYERAVTVDPTNTAGWEALQRVAAAEGDRGRVIECLEERRKHTDVPRQRAVVLVELAQAHLQTGDEQTASKCFEAAIRADPSNEPAAIAMLDTYTAQERWVEAAPLCELLVNAAVRDRDGEALFVRLRLATRIASALGDTDRALTSAMAALDARPDDPGAQADLVLVCAQSPPSLGRAREHLMALTDRAEALGADLLVRLAALLRDCDDLDGAAAALERARRSQPEDREIARQLSEVYLAQADFPRACKLKVDMARDALSADERFDLLVEAGEIWARRADELEKAASVFEEARAIKPADPWLLETLMWLYRELAAWDDLARVLGDVAEAQVTPEDKLKALLALAEVVRDEIGDRMRAAELFDQALDLDKERLDVFEQLVRTLTEEKNWERLERSYRKMIARVKDDDASQLHFLLFHQLGLIYRDRLGDASRAYDALDAASRLRPDDGEVRKIVIELLVVTDNLDSAVARLRDAIDRDPHDARLYAELYELFLRQRSFDKAWCAVNVLARLGEPNAEQRRFLDDYAPMPLDQIPGQIVEQAWRSHVLHAELEPALTSLFSLMTPAVARLRFGQLRPEERVGRPFTPTHSRMHDAIRATFDHAAEILGIRAPELLLADVMSPVPFAPALAPFGSILVCGPLVEAQSSSLVYMVGKRLAEQRPELIAHAFFPSVTDLGTLLASAVRISRNEIAKDTPSAALDASFASILTPHERDGLRRIVFQATSDGSPLDVRRWSRIADLSSMRAGLLLCGDVELARRSIEAEADAAPSEVTTRDKIGELYKFATSDLYSDLRGAIGVAVRG